MRVKALGFLLITSIGMATEMRSQVKPSGDQEEVIRVDTQLVNVPVAVISASGTSVKALKAANFVLFEDGKRQEISDFSTTSEPFEVALVLDTSGSARNDLPLIKSAAKGFVNSLRPGDRVSIIAFDTDRTSGKAFAISEILSPLTSDRTALNAAIERIKTSNGTPYYDSLLQTVDKVFREKPTEEFRGRRALVALTDGVDSTSSADFGSAKESLEGAGIISFFIKVDTREFFEESLLGDCQSATRFSAAQIKRYYRSLGIKSNTERAASFCQLGDFERLAVSKRIYEIADTEMNELAKASGGRVFPVDDLSEARAAFKSVADEIGTKYTLGYYPTNVKRDGSVRKIKVELKGVPVGSIVRARESYTAPVN